MSVKIIGKIIGKSEREEHLPLSVPVLTEEKKQNRYLESIGEEQGADKNKPNEENTNMPRFEPQPKPQEEKSEKIKEIAFFSEPKRVKRKTQKDIFVFQAAASAAICVIMLLLRFFVPELYDNLHLYFLRIFQ